MHGGDIYSTKIKYDFSVNVNPLKLPLKAAFSFFRSYASLKNYPDINSAQLFQKNIAFLKKTLLWETVPQTSFLQQ